MIVADQPLSDPVIDEDVDLQALRGRRSPDDGDDVIDQTTDVEIDEREIQFSFLNFREVEHVVDDGQQSIARGLDQADLAAHVGREIAAIEHDA